MVQEAFRHRPFSNLFYKCVINFLFFICIFREESLKFVNKLQHLENGVVNVNELASEFTLNSVIGKKNRCLYILNVCIVLK